MNATLQKKMEELQRNLLQVISVKCLFLALQLRDLNSMLPVETFDIMYQIDEKEIYMVTGRKYLSGWGLVIT